MKQDNVILNKIDTIERCLRRIKEEYANDPQNLLANQTKQDAILLNIERACQASIDIAMRCVRINKLGLPKESREAFSILADQQWFDEPTLKRLYSMVGFRNIAIHEYQELDLQIVQSIIEHEICIFNEYIQRV